MEKIFTERAHLMCPNMGFGIALTVRAEFDERRIRQSFLALAQAHPFLRAIIGYDQQKNEYYYDVTDSSKISVYISKDEVSSVRSSEVMDMYEGMSSEDFNLQNEGLLRATVWRSGYKTCFLLVFHHLLTDGRGALGLCEELAELYAGGTAPKPVEEKLISSADDLPKGSKLPMISKMLVNKANKSWSKEGQRPPSLEQYHRFASSYMQKDKISHFIYKTEKDEVKKLTSECRDNGITINDLLVARMMIKDKTDKVTVACDLRDRLPVYKQGAMGNYSTAFTVSTKKKSNDEFARAREVHDCVQQIISKPAELFLVLQCYAALDPGVLDAAFMASQGAFDSKAAAFIGKSFFNYSAPEGYCLTNLGKLVSGTISSALFIPPASPAMKKTCGVLTVNGEMRICTSERV